MGHFVRFVAIGIAGLAISACDSQVNGGMTGTFQVNGGPPVTFRVGRPQSVQAIQSVPIDGVGREVPGSAMCQGAPEAAARCASPAVLNLCVQQRHYEIDCARLATTGRPGVFSGGVCADAPDFSDCFGTRVGPTGAPQLCTADLGICCDGNGQNCGPNAAGI